MFGRYSCPFTVTGEDFSLSAEQAGDVIQYTRTCCGKRAELTIASKGTDFIVHPVEPINLPKEVTRLLEIRFSPVLLEPDVSRKIFLTFPVEIGVLVRSGDDYRLIDVFSRCAPKYSLYGIPENGAITRYHESPVFPSIPPADPGREGIIELEIRNAGRGWVEVSRVVLEAYFMSIYYGAIVGMGGIMEVYSQEMAETRLSDRPIMAGLEPAVPLVKSRKVLLVEMEKRGFLMDHGVG